MNISSGNNICSKFDAHSIPPFFRIAILCLRCSARSSLGAERCDCYGHIDQSRTLCSGNSEHHMSRNGARGHVVNKKLGRHSPLNERDES